LPGALAAGLRRAAGPARAFDLPIGRDYFLGLFLKEGLQPMIVTYSTHQDVTRTMVANGYGYTLATVRRSVSLRSTAGASYGYPLPETTSRWSSASSR